MVVPEEVFFYSKCLPAGAILLSLQEEPRACGGFLHGIEEGSNIAFHFRVYTNSMVVMNSFQEGGWQEEKRMFSDPFMPGQPFELRFLVLENEYKVCGPSRVWSAMAVLGVLWRNTRRVQL